MTKSHFITLLDQGVRLDGRELLSYREPFTVECGVSKTAEGSARVICGNTEVIAGVKVEMGKPYPDTPDQGSIMVGAELVPMSSSEYEPGPPSIKAIELARVVDRGIRESKTIDFKKLCVEEGEKAWIIIIDIVTINDDGGLFDACSLAALAAIKDMKFPEFDGTKINYKEKTDKGLELNKEPIGVTVYKVGKHFIIDPTNEEDHLSDARLTITSTKDGQLCALQKGGGSPLSEEDTSQMVDIALDKAKFLREKLVKA